VRPQQLKEQRVDGDKRVGCSIGIMAYNEEANIARTLHAVLAQTGPYIRITEVIVVASGCTDRTVPIASEIAAKEARVQLHVQEKREGKASAVNLFLKKATDEVAVAIIPLFLQINSYVSADLLLIHYGQVACMVLTCPHPFISDRVNMPATLCHFLYIPQKLIPRFSLKHS